MFEKNLKATYRYIALYLIGTGGNALSLVCKLQSFLMMASLFGQFLAVIVNQIVHSMWSADENSCTCNHLQGFAPCTS